MRISNRGDGKFKLRITVNELHGVSFYKTFLKCGSNITALNFKTTGIHKPMT